MLILILVTAISIEVKREGPRATQFAYHDVWLLRQGRAMRQHPLPHLAKGPCPLGHHTDTTREVPRAAVGSRPTVGVPGTLEYIYVCVCATRQLTEETVPAG